VTNRNKNNQSRWVLSAALLFLLSKFKSLLALLKFSKIAGTLITMILSIAAYAIAAPLPFAIGFVMLMFIHELGHGIAAKRKGLPVSAPIFIPFLGALIMTKRYPRDAVTEAYVAFGGPLIGTIGALAFLAVGMAFDSGLWTSLAYTGFFLNLINLLPIHPLDGGRIVTAVTRWLWLVGLVGGLVVIIYMGSFVFMFIWALFAWDLFAKYVWKRETPGQRLAAFARHQVNMDELLQHGCLIPGEQHQRELPFTTYSDLNGQQSVEYVWEGMIERGKIDLPVQAIIRKVQVVGVARNDRERMLTIHCRIEYETFSNDKYYEVPVKTRWLFGAAYGLLASFLGFLMYASKHLLALS
jgi:Zn-dependent protease